MNIDGKYISNKICYIDGCAYIVGGDNQIKAEKFDFKEKKWMRLPNYPNQKVNSLWPWSCALTYTPVEINQETIPVDEV